ncbi:F-box domain, cyclin-like protein [Artemisia annua]|uniref:F-box domain, cyclin-like protein n=1 Tax=Artemisia annua TaxID=35608 RepID=A0A2U1MFV7_ARTAN|nr:F-box domain, cyclin-like protein [Artemisia annua]
MNHNTTNVAGNSLLEKIPENIFYEVLTKVGDETEILTTLCTLACVSRTLHATVNKHLSSLSSIDLSAFSVDSITLNGFSKRFRKMKKITLDCFRLNEFSIKSVLGRDVEELVLLKCSSLSQDIVSYIARICPNLRVLSFEFSDFNERLIGFDNKLTCLLKDCRSLECLKIKVRMEEKSRNESTTSLVGHKFPQTVKVVELDLRVLAGSITFGPTLTHISLVLDLITDVIVCTIAQYCPLLVELELIDIPTSIPRRADNDLSDIGVQSLVGCRHLTSLSIIRKRQFVYATFTRTTHMGMILLSEGCKGLESVRLHGFSGVDDAAGFTSILNSCLNLKIFDIQNGFRLTDFAIKDVSKVHRPLVEFKLVSCSSITCQGVCELVTSSTSLEVLDFRRCYRIADSCLSNISCLTSLTSLNLGCTNVTNAGMAVLGKGNAPITCLSLRSCKKITDEGITFLLGSEGKISKTLSSLDLSHVFLITDNAITVIVDACVELIELCVRNCFMVTDEAMKTLALRGRLQPESKLLRRLDIFNCPGVSEESFEYLKKPFFRGLQWLGIKESRLIRVGDARLAEIYRQRPWLTICKDGCEVRCRDGWQSHMF